MLLEALLAGPVEVFTDGGAEGVGALRAFWARHVERAGRFEAPIDRAIAGGFAADRLGLAFAAGYREALEALAPGIAGAGIATLCATEEGGAHPRAIRTALERGAGGELRLRGKKRWSTLATEAEALLVVASVGEDEAGKNRLRVVRVGAREAGVRIAAMPAPPFAPEIPHAEVELDGVLVREADVLEGDGYEAHLKPFRTIEDVHGHAAALGYLIGAARRHGWPGALIERLAAAALAARAIAAEPPAAAATHVALAGLLAEVERLLSDAAPSWELAGEAERARWARDRPLLEVAAGARAARRERAWQRLGGRAPEPPALPRVAAPRS
ncbi:MAG: acyl-CoA dehydrogenase family protein [Polyangiaceae bacterium]|nr:acyl-CoA dehydrogenase family protein [Polyangiaceae bacterium]